MNNYLQRALILLAVLLFLSDIYSMNKDLLKDYPINNDNHFHVLHQKGIFVSYDISREDTNIILDLLQQGVFSLKYLQNQYQYHGSSMVELSLRDETFYFFEMYWSFVDFLNRQKLQKVQDLQQFCRTIEVINFSLNLFLKSVFLRSISSQKKLNLAACLMQYWNVLLHTVDLVFESESLDEIFLRNNLGVSCEFLVNGLTQWAESFRSKGMYVSEIDLWNFFYVVFFKTIKPLSLNFLSSRNIDKRRMVLRSMAFIPRSCLCLLFSGSSMHQERKLKYREILLQKIAQHLDVVKCNINNVIELQKIFENFEREVIEIHEFFASAQ